MIAVTTWGRNMAPYWVLLRSYSVGSVKIELAAGKVTKVMPWTSPARLTTRFSALDAMSWVPSSSSGFSAGARGLLRPVQHDVGHVLAVVGPGKPFGVAAVASMMAAWSRSK